MITKMFRIAAALTVSVFLASPVLAEGRQFLGWGGVMTNDLFWQGIDRWRTGGVSLSFVSGPEWQGALPANAGQVIEYRLYGGAIAPASLTGFNPNDRRYAGIVALGLHSHFARHGYDLSFGVDAIAVGPQTGISDFHTWLHKAIGLPAPTIMDSQFGNALYLSPMAEIGREVDLGAARLRPFLQAQAGAEDLARAGFDLTLGELGQGGLMLRDGDSGQRYSVIQGSGQGMSLTIGGDVARVFDSAFLPDGGPVTRSDTRQRLRVGLDLRDDRMQAFYGLSWLGPEFDEQPEGQVTGAVSFRLNF